MKSAFTTLAFVLCLLSGSYAQEQDYCSGQLTGFRQNEVTLSPSWIQQREQLNLDYLRSLDPDRLLHNFRVNAGLPSQATAPEGWESPGVGLRGHFTGHYLSALARVAERKLDDTLEQRLKYMVSELHKCQQALGNGYLSAFPEADFDTLERNFGGVWAPYYTYHKIMQGLLDAYTRTGNEEAYQMVTDMAAYVEQRMSRLSAESIEKMLYTAAANPSNEAGAMNEVLYGLYKVSHNPRHLALAKVFDRDWFAGPLAQNKDILSGLHANTHIVLVNGFVQRYDITGETFYRDAALHFWDMLMHSHAYANGSSSGPRPNPVTPTSLTAEHWGIPGVLSNTLTPEIAESCVSHNTQKLTSYLFCRTRNAAYADSYMNTFYNAVLASQNSKTGATVYHLPLGAPRNKKFLKENDFRCCNGTCIEAFTSLNSAIYYHDRNNLWVNLYVPSTVNWKDRGLVLEQTGNLPNDSVVVFTISARKGTEAGINLLIPSWANNVTVYLNDKLLTTRAFPQSYLNLNRKWSNGDRIKLVFSYGFHLKAMPDNANVVALFYGPAMLAFETSSEIILKGTHEDILRNLSRQNTTFKLTNAGKTYYLRPLYDICEESYGVYASIKEQ